MRVDSNISTDDSPMNERTPSSSSPPCESVTEEKCRLFFADCDKRARHHTNISTFTRHMGKRERKHLHFFINERSCFSRDRYIKKKNRLSEIIINSVSFLYYLKIVFYLYKIFENFFENNRYKYIENTYFLKVILKIINLINRQKILLLEFFNEKYMCLQYFLISKIH